MHGLAVPAGAEHLLGDDGFIERVLLDDAPEMAEDADITLICILTTRHGVRTVSLSGFLKWRKISAISFTRLVGVSLSAAAASLRMCLPAAINTSRS